MKVGAAVVALFAGSLGGATAGVASALYEGVAAEMPAGTAGSAGIDQAVFERLHAEGVALPKLCSDSVFLRRASLVVTGSLPSESETRAFLASGEATKREELVDRLLASEAFVDFSAMRWCDVLRVKAEFPINLWPAAVQSYYRYVRASLAANKPYHEFVRELLTANGSNFRVGEANFYRAMQDRSPEGIASTVALTFMGERTEHWPARKHAATAAFFSRLSFKPTSEWKEEIVFFDLMGSVGEPLPEMRFPDGRVAKIDKTQDPREVFASWLVRPENEAFSRTICNRVWFWLMGRGIVHEPDDFRADNPPSNPALLKHLQEEFVASGCDLRALYRVILNSQVFQASSVSGGGDLDPVLFASYPPRRVEAEVLIDAINTVTGTAESYSSPIPEPFTFVPEGTRAIAIADGSITSSFLELFGRPARDTGRALERNLSVSPAQRLHLLNSTHVQKKIRSSPLVRMVGYGGDLDPNFVDRVYLSLLCRPATREELAAIDAYSDETNLSGRELAVDVVWALINGPEFLMVF